MAQRGLPTALSHLTQLTCLHIQVHAYNAYDGDERYAHLNDPGREHARAVFGSRLAKVREFEVARVRAIRAVPLLAMHALPALRVLAVGNDQPGFRSKAERLGVDEPGLQRWEESAHLLDEMRRLSAEGTPEREARWWRVDGTGEGEGRELVEIWDGKGKLAFETIERPDFNADRDLDCEYIRHCRAWMAV